MLHSAPCFTLRKGLMTVDNLEKGTTEFHGPKSCNIDTYPRPPCFSNTKVPKLGGNNTYCCSDEGVLCARGKKASSKMKD